MNTKIMGAASAALLYTLPLSLWAQDQPNIVFLLVDDLGWGELASYGNTFNETPNINQMASEGVTFTNAYASAPVSSPTRACLHTGQYTPRHGIFDYLADNASNYLDPSKHVTLNEALQEAGYTTGILGKWHLDTDFDSNLGAPKLHGFDYVFGTETTYIAGGDYFYPYDKISTITTGEENEFLTDRLCSEAMAFMEENKDNPFFVSIQLFSVHGTPDAPEDLVEKYKQKYDDKYGEGSAALLDENTTVHSGAPDNPYIAAMLEKIDNNVALILAKIEELGLDDNTIFIFTSDNGGDEPFANNGELRECKTWLYEGGIRVPLIIRYPQHALAGSVVDEPVTTVDFYPTFLELADNATTTQLLDGVSIVPLLSGEDIDREAIYWHYTAGASTWNERKATVVRRGDYKLIYRYGLGAEYYELYNLTEDISETNDLINVETTIAEELKVLLHTWMEEMNLATWQEGVEYDIADFETPFTGDYGTKGNSTPPYTTTDEWEDEAHESFYLIENPYEEEDNTTATVGKFIRDKDGYWWAYAWFNFDETYVVASDANPVYLHVMVRKPIKSNICLQLVGSHNCSTPEIQKANTLTDEWEDVVFTINNSGYYNSLQFKADFDSSSNPPYPDRLSEDMIVYFDEIIINDDPQPRGGELIVEPEEYVIQDFENGFSGTWGTNGNGGGLVEDHDAFNIVDNPFVSPTNNSEKVGAFNRKVDGSWWAYTWFEFENTTLYSSPKYLHIMVNKPIVSTICVQVKDAHSNPTFNTQEMSSSEQTLVDEWQDIVYEINTTGTMSYFEFKPDFVNSTVSSRLDSDIMIYFDDIVVNNSPNPRTEVSSQPSIESDNSSLLTISSTMVDSDIKVYNHADTALEARLYSLVSGSFITEQILPIGGSSITVPTLGTGWYLLVVDTAKGKECFKIYKY